MKGKRIIGMIGLFLVCCAGAYIGIENELFALNPLLIPKDSMRGVDISFYQGNVDMETLKKQNISFLYMKATEGTTYTDPLFAQNWKKSAAAGLPAGAYHFFSFHVDGKEQARHFLQVMGTDLNGRLIPVVDIEYHHNATLEKEEVIRELTAFMNEVEQQTGVKPMIYTSPKFFRKYLKGTFDEYPRWMSSLKYPLRWDFSQDWTVWQYSDQAELSGYDGDEKHIDLNVLHPEKEISDILAKGSDDEASKDHS